MMQCRDRLMELSMSQVTQQIDLAPMPQVKYFSAETVNAAWLRASVKFPCGKIEMLPLLCITDLVIMENVISKNKKK